MFIAGIKILRQCNILQYRATLLSIVLSIPVCPWRWASHETGSFSILGRTTCHLPSLSSCILIINTLFLTSVRCKRSTSCLSAKSLDSTTAGFGATPVSKLSQTRANGKLGDCCNFSNSTVSTIAARAIAVTCSWFAASSTRVVRPPLFSMRLHCWQCTVTQTHNRKLKFKAWWQK